MIGMKKEKENIRCLCDTARIRNVITRRNVSSDVVISLSESRMNKEAAVILSPEVGVKISGASVEPVVCDGIKTNRYSAQRDLYTHSLRSGFKMTASVFALVFVLIFGTISELRAETIDSGTCNYTGTCLWQLDSDYKLTISGSGSMTNYSRKEGVYLDYKNNPRPWEKYIEKISSISVDGTIDNIGARTFAGAHSLLSVNIPDVKILGDYAFNGAVNLTSIFMPKVEEIYEGTFQNAKKLTSLDIPKLNSMRLFGGPNLSYINIPESTRIRYFDTETDKYAYRQLTLDDFEHIFGDIACSLSEGHWICGSCGIEYDKSGLGCVADCGVGYLGKDGICIDSALGCGAGYKQFENFCNRIRYTPAEAAAVLKDDNTNAVTLTFRK